MPISFTVDDIGDQTGRTAVVTGANNGLGLVVAQQLAARGATVVMAVRDVAKAERVRPAGAEVHRLDLADLDSVRSFADALGDRPVDLLVNNAGIGNRGRQLSPYGVELQFATNVLGHFALTGRLLPRLRAGREARVVHVSSGFARYAKGLPLDDLAAERSYSPMGAYNASKLGNLLFGLELDRRLRRAGLPVRSLVAHPGMARTSMNDSPSGLAEKIVVGLMRLLLSRSAEDGALPILYAATSPDAPTGVFLGPSRGKWDSRVRFGDIPGAARDAAPAARLWQVAEETTGVRFLDEARL